MADAARQWVLLSYWLPPVPSTPRSTVWRTLKRLGAAQLGDGLVALPADARTREALEWVAETVVDNAGRAMLWLGQPLEQAALTQLVERMTAAVATEYTVVQAEAEAQQMADPATRRRVAARLRRELRRIGDRDFFPPPARDTARAAVEALAAALEEPVRP